MKSFICFVLCIASLNLWGQKLDCCNTAEEIQKMIIGTWRLQNANNTEQERYWFNNNIGGLEYIDPQSGAIISDHVIVEIVEKDDGFIVKHIDLLETTENKIQLLDQSKMILLSENGKSIVYLKLKPL